MTTLFQSFALYAVRFEVHYEPDWHDWVRETCDASGRALICISAMENLIRGGLKMTQEILHGSFFFKKKTVPHFAQLGRYEFFVSKPLEHAGNWTVIQIRYPNGAFKDFSFTADSIDKRNLGYVWAHDFNIGMSYNSGIAIGLGD
jgi:hypothetical protein